MAVTERGSVVIRGASEQVSYSTSHWCRRQEEFRQQLRMESAEPVASKQKRESRCPCADAGLDTAFRSTWRGDHTVGTA
jgi:hypothetical protein